MREDDVSRRGCSLRWVVRFGALLAGLWVEPAGAHVRLDAPIARYPIPEVEDGSNLKVGPCGAASDGRTQDASRVTTFTAGSTITVRFHETIHHDSHYRISFDDSGQDAFVDPTHAADIVEPPQLPVLLDGIPDKTSGPDEYSVEIELPDIVCDHCTLQLIQYMYDRSNPMYYQCADIVLVRGAAPGSGGQASSGGGAPSSGGSGADPGAENAAGGAPAPPPGSGTEDEQVTGCSSGPPSPRDARSGWLATLALVFATTLRLRRGRERALRS